MALKILKEQYNELSRRPISDMGITVGLENGDNYFEWRVTIMGAKDTCYEGSTFIVNIKFPEDYPKRGPEIVFRNPIYHINVNPNDNIEGESRGHVSFKAIDEWKPETTAKELLIKLFSIFYWPNPDCCYGIQRAEEFINKKSLYDLKTRYFVKKYASGLAFNTIYNKDWDFSCDEKNLNDLVGLKKELTLKELNDNDNEIITLEFSDGKKNIYFKCKMNEPAKDVVQRVINKLGITKKIDSDDILFITQFRRLILDISIKSNRLKNGNSIIIICRD